MLIEAVESREGLRYTRQALHRHERIRLAFRVRKKALLGQEVPPRELASLELRVTLDRMARLEAENQRLAAENNALLEQFARWAYNAHTRNLTNEFLKALPAVDRERSKQPRLVRKPIVVTSVLDERGQAQLLREGLPMTCREVRRHLPRTSDASSTNAQTLLDILKR